MPQGAVEITWANARSLNVSEANKTIVATVIEEEKEEETAGLDGIVVSTLVADNVTMNCIGVFHHKLLLSPMRKALQQHLLQHGESVMQLHVNALALDGMIAVERPSSVAVPSEEEFDLDPKKAIERACSAAKMSNTLVVAKKYFGNSKYYGSEEIAFPAELNFQVMESLWARLSPTVEVRPFSGSVYWSEAVSPNSMPWPSVDILARSLTQMNFIAGSILYLNADFLSPRIDFLDDDTSDLKGNVAVAIDDVEDQIQLASSNLRNADAIPGHHLQNLKFDYSDCCSWIENAFVVLSLLEKSHLPGIPKQDSSLERTVGDQAQL